MAAKDDRPAQREEITLNIMRLFHAPRELVFAAWTRSEHLERWQGAPMGMTVTVHEVDFRPGGTFRLCMRSADGKDHWLGGVYQEIVEPRRLVFTHGWLNAEGKPGQQTLVTIEFNERGGKTELVLRQTGFKSA
ncbi:MAG: SRPBCC domain-containing protein, partial [Tepidisphaeraceae bacterium]